MCFHVVCFLVLTKPDIYQCTGHVEKSDWITHRTSIRTRDHFGLHQGKNVTVTMEFEVPKRHISRPTLSTNMVQPDLRWRGKRGAMVKKRQGHIAENYCYNIFLWMFFLGKRREDPKKWSNLNFSQNCPFWAYIIRKKISTFSFWCMVIPLGPHSVYT